LFVHRHILFIATLIIGGGQALGQAPSQDSYDYFRLNCTSCHTIGGGDLTGPDLKGVLDRQERDWLISFMMDPAGIIDGGDPYAQEIFRAAKGQYMNKIPSLDRKTAGALLDLVTYESTLEKSVFAGMQLSDRPLTKADEKLGRRLFLGQQEFAAGGPACNSCHTLAGLGGFGGGRLGPDLNSAYSRLDGRKALSAWLSAPPSEVMAPVFADHPLEGDEVLALVAFLKRAAASGVMEAEPQTLDFLLASFGGAALVLILLDLAWRKRYRATRRPLLNRTKAGKATR
jgi:cytochrome c2